VPELLVLIITAMWIRGTLTVNQMAIIVASLAVSAAILASIGLEVLGFGPIDLPDPLPG
jgi:hypothetical protein